MRDTNINELIEILKNIDAVYCGDIDCSRCPLGDDLCDKLYDISEQLKEGGYEYEEDMDDIDEDEQWRYSDYENKDISDWDVDDHLAAWYDDRMEK